MKNNTIMEYAENGIIIRYENDGRSEVIEDKKGDYTFPSLTDSVKTIARAYGEIVANTLDCFDEETLWNAVGYKINIKIVPVFDRNKLIPKQKK